MSRKQDSGSICKTSGATCQSCRRWFKHKWELHFHMQTRCPPVTRTLGNNNLHCPLTSDIANLTRAKHPSILQRRGVTERVTSARPGHTGQTVPHQSTSETISLNNTANQTRATLDTNASIRDWVLPPYKAKKATYDRKDPARVCIHCGVEFIRRANKAKQDLKCNSTT